ncbi:MAG: UDP-N-acetylglucosamine--LPS N-acetylglucosamine transferase [Bacillota bacterium]|nr:UDP-N-acetylglucosamine--LPS N-acetylglucosamine transferase [Bacillota bacterium]
MIKNILIISSDHTGHGHKSITESLCEKIPQNSNINIHVVDGFSLGGHSLLKIGKSYGPITRHVEGLWQLIWSISSIKPDLINKIISSLIRTNLLKLLDKVKPDLILSVHPNFNGSVIDILEEQNLKIPFITLIADLVSIYPLWADPRAAAIISPTEEAKEKCIEYGVTEEKIKVFGFPVRSKFHNHNGKHHYDINTSLNCLIMSGGEGVGNMSNIAKILLDNFNCNVKIVAGRNIALKEHLEKSLIGKYGNKVQIYGFTKNIQDLMLSSDIAFTRGSPNVMMEAISCNVPIIITGALPGQEQGNPEFAAKYNLAVICENLDNLKNTIDNLLLNNAEKLNQIKNSQRAYINPHAAENIVDFILNYEGDYNEAAVTDVHPDDTKLDSENVSYET